MNDYARAARAALGERLTSRVFSDHALPDGDHRGPIDFLEMEADERFKWLSTGERALFYFAWSIYTAHDGIALRHDAGINDLLLVLDVETFQGVLAAIAIRAGVEMSTVRL